MEEKEMEIKERLYQQIKAMLRDEYGFDWFTDDSKSAQLVKQLIEEQS